MGNFAINNGGVQAIKEGLPSIDVRFGPYTSVAEAHTALSVDNLCAVGLTVGIISGNIITEYCSFKRYVNCNA